MHLLVHLIKDIYFFLKALTSSSHHTKTHTIWVKISISSSCKCLQVYEDEISHRLASIYVPGIQAQLVQAYQQSIRDKGQKAQISLMPGVAGVDV